MSKRRPSIDWHGLTRRIESSLKGLPGFGSQPRVEGKLSYIAEGIGHDNYLFAVAGESYVLRMPKRFDPVHSPPRALELLNREMETLRRLELASAPFRTPKLICAVPDENGAMMGFIETGVHGYALKYMDRGVNGRSRLAVIAEAAAQIHALPVSDFGHLAPCADSASHVQQSLAEIPDSLWKLPVAAAAREWILAHLGHRPAVVLHGDLLPQNLLVDLMNGDAICVLDWEYAQLGDPAFDLAIVTRGSRQPLKESGGFQKLVAAYELASGHPMPASAVRIHEMLMIIKWLADSSDPRTRREAGGQGPEYYADQLAGVLRRSQAES